MDNNNSFLFKVATFFTNQTAIQNTCFVFPNRRAGLFFRNYIAQQFQHPIFSPTILTIDECFHELCNLQPQPFLTLILKLYSIYQKLFPSSESFDRFIYWGKLLLQDFSEIDNHLIPNVKELFTNVQDINTINHQYDYLNETQKKAIQEFWGVVIQSQNKYHQHPTTNNPTNNFILLWKKLYPLYQNLRNELSNQNKAYEGMIHRHVIENWNNIDPSQKRNHYTFIAFNALTKSEEELMLHLQNENKATFFFDYSKYPLTDPNNKASLFFHHNTQLFSHNMPLKNEETNPNMPIITTHTTPSTIAQVHEVYNILMQIYPPNNINNNYIDTAIILPDEKMLIPILHAIPSHIDKINVTMGFPIKATNIYSFIKNIYNLHDRKKNTNFYYKNVLAILTHPFLQTKYKKQATSIINQIKKENLIFINEKFFNNHPTLKNLFVTPSNEPLSTLLYIKQLLTTFAHNDNGAKDLTLTQITLIEENILDCPSIKTTKEIFVLLLSLLDNLSIPFTGEPLQGLQIMGVLESRALNFKNVIFVNFNDDTYPGKLLSHSFIPIALRKGFHLPTPERQDSIFAYNFYKLALNANNLHLIYNNTNDEKTSSEPSRFLLQLALQYNTPIQIINSVPNNSQKIQTGEPRIKKTQNDIDILINKMRTDGISPTWIKNYIKCPLFFYWINIKNISQPQVEDIASPLQIGTTFHNIMQSLYSPHINQMMTVAILQNIKNDFILQWNDNNSPIQSILQPIKDQQLVKSALFNFVLQQLHNDSQDTPFTIVSLEEEFSYQLELNNNYPITLKGKIDRIDIQQNTIRLIDYKTGDISVNVKSINDLFVVDDENTNTNAFQVIFYCLLYQNHTQLPLSPHLFSTKKKETQIKIGKENFNFNSIKADFVTNLKKILDDIINPNIPFKASSLKQTCKTCQFYNLCKLLS